MSGRTPLRIKIGLLAALAGLAGCENKKSHPVVQLAPDTTAYDTRSRELEDALRAAQAAQAERDALKERLAQLQKELDGLRQQLAAKPEPEPPPNWASVPGGAMTSIEGTILFDSGKATLKPGAKETLDGVVKVIKERYPDYDVYVFGHTDNEPIKHSTWKDNYELSCQRALSVTRYLRDTMGSANVAAGGWGEYRPLEENNSAQNRQANRRVEIYAMRPQENAPAGRSMPPRGNG